MQTRGIDNLAMIVSMNEICTDSGGFELDDFTNHANEVNAYSSYGALGGATMGSVLHSLGVSGISVHCDSSNDSVCVCAAVGSSSGLTNPENLQWSRLFCPDQVLFCKKFVFDSLFCMPKRRIATGNFQVRIAIAILLLLLCTKGCV